MGEQPKAQGWWQTLPGMLTATAGVLTALAGLIIALQQVGVFRGIRSGAAEGQGGIGSPSQPKDDAGTAKAAGGAPSPSGEHAAGYPISVPAGAEIKVGAGEVVYKILAVQLDRQAEGALLLRFSVRATNNGRYDLNLWGASFRLLVDGVPRAPVNFVDELVSASGAKEADFVFVIPDGTQRVDFLVVNQQGTKDTYRVPIDLKAAEK